MGERLKGKSAIITFGARGQGAAQARLFVAEGAKVTIADTHDEHGRALAAELGPNAQYRALDVGDPEAWDATVAAATEAFGGVDILINGAGVNFTGMMEDTTVDDFMRVVRNNQLGPWLGMKAVTPAMRARGGGSIVNVISASVIAGLAGKSAYAGSKHAIRGMTGIAARELGRHGVRVNAVLPAGVATELNVTATRTLQDLDKTYGLLPIPRIGRAEEVAAAVLFLASDEASYCTGSELVVDGGATAAPMQSPNPDHQAKSSGAAG